MINIFLSSNSPYIANKTREIRGLRAVPHIAQLLDVARRASVPVIFVNHAFRKVGNQYDDGGMFERIEYIAKVNGSPSLPLSREMKDAFLEGSYWTKTVDALTPTSSDYVVRKNRNSCFYGGDLETLLRQLEVRKIIVTGISTNLCVRATCFDAFQKGWRTIVPKECVESYSDRAQEQGLEDLAFTTSEVVDLSSLLQQLSKNIPVPTVL